MTAREPLPAGRLADSANGLPDAIADYIGEHCPSEFPAGADRAAGLIMHKIVNPLLAEVARLCAELDEARAQLAAEPRATDGAVDALTAAVRDATCPAEYGGPGYTHCELAAGHDGQHESAIGNMRRATWGEAP